MIQRLQEAVNEQMQMPSDRRQDGSFGSQPDSSEKEDALPKVMSPLEKNVGGGTEIPSSLYPFLYLVTFFSFHACTLFFYVMTLSSTGFCTLYVQVHNVYLMRRNYLT